MMPIIFFVLGISVLIINTVDFISTTLLIGRGGPFSSYVSAKLWQLLLAYHSKKSSHNLLYMGGTILVLFNLFIWTTLIWVGWGLIFLVSPDSILRTDTLLPAAFWEKMYYLGFTIITLGVGDYQAGSNVWRMLTVIASFNGFFLLTLAITYLVSIVSSVISKRGLAGYISSLGHTPEDIVIRSYQHGHLNNLIPHFNALTPMILNLTQQHMAYPVLHSFHSAKPQTSFVISIAALDEALTILEHGISPNLELPSTTIYSLRRAITTFISSQNKMVTLKILKSPPLPDLQLLENHGISIIDPEVFEEKLKKLKKRREWLYSLIHRDGWNWEEVLKQNVNYEESTMEPTVY